MAKRKPKSLKKLTKEKEYYARKIDEMESERDKIRDWDHKALLTKMKRIKLWINDQIQNLLKE
jgi:uncharacterized membrane protein